MNLANRQMGRYAHFSFETRSERKWDYVFPLTINYDQPFGEMVEAGAYDSVHEHMTSQRFPITNTGVVKTHVHLMVNGGVSAQDMHSRMARKGLRPANIDELLAFGAMYPEQQCQGSILAIGSVSLMTDAEIFPGCSKTSKQLWRAFPYLSRNPLYGTRCLGVISLTASSRLGGNPYWAFLAVPIYE